MGIFNKTMETIISCYDCYDTFHEQSARERTDYNYRRMVN